MATTEEIKYLEQTIRKLIASVEHEYYQFFMRESYEHDFQEEYPGWTKSWLKDQIKNLYTLISAYLEMKQMNSLLQRFKDEFGERITQDENLLKAELTHPEGEDELILMTDFKRVLDSFKAFNYLNEKDEDTKKLKSILKNTDHILKNIDRVINNEADIYKEIKWVLRLYFPSTRSKNNASFIQEFQTYNPDILIPEIQTVIEYKYIKDKKDSFDKYLDQIKVDATNYVGDSKYDNFIAVIYVQHSSIATPESIEVAWKSKMMPNNWILIVANGSAVIEE